MLEAVARNGRALYYASLELQGDRPVVLKAVQQDGEALYDARWVFRADRQVVLEAILLCKKSTLRFERRFGQRLKSQIARFESAV